MTNKKILIFGYGNPDREDDGVAWHILQQLADYYHHPVSACGADLADGQPFPHLVFALQLAPEMAEDFAAYDALCFVDAHTGAYPEEVRWIEVSAGYQVSAFTHHLTPETCLALTEALYHRTPTAIIVSVRGYSFGYADVLSDQTAALAQQAKMRIMEWIQAQEAT